MTAATGRAVTVVRVAIAVHAGIARPNNVYERTELPNGIRALTEVVPGQRAVTVGAWIATGSRHEPAELNGVSHFLEHLVFKGTPSRSALDIAQVFDAIGGDLNAFTTREFTCFHARALGEDLPLCVDTIADIVRNATLTPDDVESERSVVLEEIAMHEDTPDDNVFDLFNAAFWPEHPLGMPVQGVDATVSAMSRDAIAAWYGARYGDVVVSASGAVSHAELLELVARAFDGPVARVAPPAKQTVKDAAGAVAIRERDIEQAHVVYGTRGFARGDERRWALEVMNVALGGGMSSRLFQEIREKRGLAYAVSSGHGGYAETGVFNVYAGCSTENIKAVLEIAREHIDAVIANGITEAERARAVGHLRGSLLLSLDDPGARMSHLGKSELLLEEILTPEQMIAKLEAVTLDEAHSVARDVLGSSPWSLAVLGPVSEADIGGFTGAAA